MNHYAEQGRDNLRAVGANYMSYAFSAQQELFQLGMNLFQREIETGRKIAASRDVTQAFVAFNNLMKETVEDISAATTRLLDQASAVGSKSIHETEDGLRAVGESAARSAETAARHASAAMEDAAETSNKAGRAAAEATRPRKTARD